MSIATFSNCTSRFVFMENGSEDYPLLTSDMEVVEQYFPMPYGSNALFVGKNIEIKGTKYIITQVHTKFYKEPLDESFMEDQEGQPYNFNVEIWCNLDKAF